MTIVEASGLILEMHQAGFTDINALSTGPDAMEVHGVPPVEACCWRSLEDYQRWQDAQVMPCKPVLRAA